MFYSDTWNIEVGNWSDFRQYEVELNSFVSCKEELRASVLTLIHSRKSSVILCANDNAETLLAGDGHLKPFLPFPSHNRNIARSTLLPNKWIDR